MNLSVSNIAWRREENGEALELLKRCGINNIEIAPSLLFKDHMKVEDEEIMGLRGSYNKKGLRFVSMQSLLFGAPQYSIFDERIKTDELLNYLERSLKIAHILGIKNAVFGSPKNRFAKDPGTAATLEKAKEFFQQVARLAEKWEVQVSLEANPVEYGCNFLNTTLETLDFVTSLDQPSIKLNFDLGATIMNNEDVASVALKAKDSMGHIHLSAPHLGAVDDFTMDHARVSKAIRGIGFNGYVSLEIKASDTSSNLDKLESSVAILKRYYG